MCAISRKPDPTNWMRRAARPHLTSASPSDFVCGACDEHVEPAAQTQPSSIASVEEINGIYEFRLQAAQAVQMVLPRPPYARVSVTR